MNLFNSSGAFISGTAPTAGDRTKCILVLKNSSESGEKTTPTFLMTGECTGGQSARIQVDATADSSLSVVGCSSGIGSFRVTLYDSPIMYCKDNKEATKESSLKKYLGFNTLDDRKATIIFYHQTGNNSKTIGKLTGIITNMTSSLRSGDTGEGGFFVAFTLKGIWSAS